MPKIGAGYGGLSWRKVRGLIETAFAEWPGTVYVYEDYHAEQPAADADADSIPVAG